MALERIVRPPGGGALLGVSSFWIWHCLNSSRSGRRPAINLDVSTFSAPACRVFPLAQPTVVLPALLRRNTFPDSGWCRNADKVPCNLRGK